MKTDTDASRSTIQWSLVANISLLFAELPILDRIQAAVDAGFHSIEAWWPFTTAVPDTAEVDTFIAAIDRAGTTLTGLNFFAGDMSSGERGLVSRPDRSDEFVANTEVVADIAARTGARGFNALYGQRQPGMDAAEQDAVGFDNLVRATRRLAEVGGTVLIEPLSHGLNGEYPIETAQQAVDLVRGVREATGLANIGFLFDTFHLSNNHEDLTRVIADHAECIGHVQLADAPGRGAPGTGAIDFGAVLAALDRAGYAGLIACEYASGGPTGDTLGWVADEPLVRLGSRLPPSSLADASG